jgi:capsular polysaccharide biosynthesis protein
MREVDVLNTRIKALSNQYTTLSNEVVNSEINRSSFTDYSVKILSPALTAEQGGRGDLVKLFLAPILALMVGIGLAFYMENLDHSISNREDVERHVNIPVLASFPETRVGEFGSRTSGSFGPASIPFRRRGSGRL